MFLVFGFLFLVSPPEAAIAKTGKSTLFTKMLIYSFKFSVVIYDYCYSLCPTYAGSY